VDVCTDSTEPRDLCGLTNMANGMRRCSIGFLWFFAGCFPWRAATAQTQTAWTGDLGSWAWDGTGWTLDLGGAGTAWLATCPGPTAQRRWEWHADFAPSTANFSRVFLFDADSTAGHFLHLGSAGSLDPVVLYGMAAGSTPTPLGEAFPGYFAAGMASTWTATPGGLACTPLETTPPAFPAAAFAWAEDAVPACIGILATVTASNASGVRFVLLPDSVSAPAPRLQTAALLAPDTLLLCFDAPVTPGGLLGAEGPLAAPMAVPHPSGWPGPSGCFHVPLAASVAEGGSADFATTGWTAGEGALVPDTGFVVWRALDTLPAGSLAFTEVMADPTPATRWAELEWVEVYNPGPHALDVAQATWWDAGTGMAGLEPLMGWDGLLPPGERAVLSGGPEPVDPTGEVRPRQMRWTGGGTLLDAGDGIGLLGAGGWAAVLHFERGWWDGAGGGTSVSAACPRCCGAAANWGPQEASPGGPAPVEHAPIDAAPVRAEVLPMSPQTLAVRCDRALDPAALVRVVPASWGTAECVADTVWLRARDPWVSGPVRVRVEGVRACLAPASRGDTLFVELDVQRFPVVEDLAITEILASPAGRTEELGEFVEIMNLTADTIECSGLKINGLPFGMRWLLPQERRALPAGVLPNAGGTVLLTDAFSQVLERVEYSACAHGDRRNEESGRSLVRLDPFGPANDLRNWDSSAAELGASPGTVDPREEPWNDTAAPRLLCTASGEDGKTVLVFDEPLAASPAGWQLWQPPSGTPLWPERVWVADAPGTVSDAAGQTVTIAWKALAHVSDDPRGWTLNEVLAEPGSHAEPFLELRHNSPQGIGLADLYFAATALPDPSDWAAFSGFWEGLPLVLPAGEWAFARCPNRLHTSRALPFDLPGLSGERTVQLGTASAPLEAVDIGASRHVPWLHSRTGISLERTRPEPGAPWVSASVASTPGTINSQWMRGFPATASAFSCNPGTIRLHPAPPPNAAVMRWTAPELGPWQTTCSVFSLTGEPVALLPGSATVAGEAEGSWTWDGSRDGCCPVAPGAYWIQLEACSETADCIRAWSVLRVAP